MLSSLGNCIPNLKMALALFLKVYMYRRTVLGTDFGGALTPPVPPLTSSQCVLLQLHMQYAYWYVLSRQCHVLKNSLHKNNM